MTEASCLFQHRLYYKANRHDPALRFPGGWNFHCKMRLWEENERRKNAGEKSGLDGMRGILGFTMNIQRAYLKPNCHGPMILMTMIHGVISGGRHLSCAMERSLTPRKTLLFTLRLWLRRKSVNTGIMIGFEPE